MDIKVDRELWRRLNNTALLRLLHGEGRMGVSCEDCSGISSDASVDLNRLKGLFRLLVVLPPTGGSCDEDSA